VPQIRLRHRRMPFVRACPRESQERVFDAHDQAFAFFHGRYARSIQENLEASVRSRNTIEGRAAERGLIEAGLS
jgi:transposase